MIEYFKFPVVLALILLLASGNVRAAEEQAIFQADEDLIAAEAYIDRGITYYDKSQYDQAISDLSKAIVVNPNLARAYAFRGLAHNARRRYDLALPDCNKAIEIDPNFAMAYAARAGAYRGKRQYDLAISDCNRAIELDPNLASAYTALAGVYLDRGQYDHALSYCDRAVEVDPSSARAYVARAGVCVARDLFDQAISDSSKAIELNGNLVIAYAVRSAAYWAKDQYDRAMYDCSAAIEMSPNSADGYIARAGVYLDRGQYDLALSDCSKAIEADPDSVELHMLRGIAHIGKGQYEQSVSAFNRAIELDPYIARAYFLRSMAYALKGRHDRAVSDLDEAFEIDPNLTVDQEVRDFIRYGFSRGLGAKWTGFDVPECLSMREWVGRDGFEVNLYGLGLFAEQSDAYADYSLTVHLCRLVRYTKSRDVYPYVSCGLMGGFIKKEQHYDESSLAWSYGATASAGIGVRPGSLRAIEMGLELGYSYVGFWGAQGRGFEPYFVVNVNYVFNLPAPIGAAMTGQQEHRDQALHLQNERHQTESEPFPTACCISGALIGTIAWLFVKLGG